MRFIKFLMLFLILSFVCNAQVFKLEGAYKIVPKSTTYDNLFGLDTLNAVIIQGTWRGNEISTAYLPVNDTDSSLTSLLSSLKIKQLIRVPLDSINAIRLELNNLNTYSHTHTNKSIIDLITSAFTDADSVNLGANTAARHSHVNKIILDLIESAYTDADSVNVAANTVNRHSHTNKSTLDLIESAYKDSDSTKLAGIESGAEVNNISDLDADTLTTGKDASYLHIHDLRYYTETETRAVVSDSLVWVKIGNNFYPKNVAYNWLNWNLISGDTVTANHFAGGTFSGTTGTFTSLDATGLSDGYLVYVGSGALAASEIQRNSSTEYTFMTNTKITNLGIATISNVTRRGEFAPTFKVQGFSATTGAYPYMRIQKSHTNTVDTWVQTIDTEVLGSFEFYGVNSSPNERLSSYFQCVQVGSSGATYVPSKIVFNTSSSSGINNNHLVLMNDKTSGINTSAPGVYALAINEASGNVLDLIYNDADGSPSNHVAVTVDATGNGTIAPSGGTFNITGKLDVSDDLNYSLRHAFIEFYGSYAPDLTQDVRYKLTPTFTTIEASNITVGGDTLTIVTDGDYYITINATIQGAINEDYSFIIYKNYSTAIDSAIVTTTLASNYSPVPLQSYIQDLAAGDDISFYIRNLSNNNDATIRKMTVYIEKKHD